MPLSADAARVPLARALLHVVGELPLRWHTAGDLDACAGERAPHDWCVMLPVSQRVQPGVYTLMALSRYRDALVQRCGPERPLVYQTAYPADSHSLLPDRSATTSNFRYPSANDPRYLLYNDILPATTHHVSQSSSNNTEKQTPSFSHLGWTHKPHLPSSLLTWVSMATCGMPRSMRCSRMDPPPPTAVTSRHVQGPCGQTCGPKRCPMLQASPPTLPSSCMASLAFLGLNEAAHGSVGLTRR